jgi:hypothetical protein
VLIDNTTMAGGAPEKATQLIKDKIAKWALIDNATGMGPEGTKK